MKEISSGIQQIMDERENQIAHGYDAEHDDNHTTGDLAVNAAELILEAYYPSKNPADHWGLVELHGHDKVRSLQIAGALIVAELERFERIMERDAE